MIKATTREHAWLRTFQYLSWKILDLNHQDKVNQHKSSDGSHQNQYQASLRTSPTFKQVPPLHWFRRSQSLKKVILKKLSQSKWIPFSNHQPIPTKPSSKQLWKICSLWHSSHKVYLTGRDSLFMIYNRCRKTFLTSTHFETEETFFEWLVTF